MEIHTNTTRYNLLQKLNKPQAGPSRETMKKDQGTKRKLRRENTELENIIDTKRTKQNTDSFHF